MSEQTIDAIVNRIASVCAGAPFDFTRAATPFSFALQPTGEIDAVFRLESQSGQIIGGFNYSEERTDEVRIWVARKLDGDPTKAYERLQCDVSSLRAAVIRDGVSSSGDYHVPDAGADYQIEHEQGHEYAVLQLTLPVNYEAVI